MKKLTVREISESTNLGRKIAHTMGMPAYNSKKNARTPKAKIGDLPTAPGSPGQALVMKNPRYRKFFGMLKPRLAR